MKKLIALSMLLSTAIFISCGDDDDTSTVALSGNVTFGGQSYTISSGILTETLTSSGVEGQFFLADGTITASGGGASSSDSEIIIAVRAISEGSTTIDNGSYEVNRQVTSQYAFVTVTAGSSSSVQSFVGGTIDISGADNTYSLTFNDVTFGGGIGLTGSVNGTFAN